MEERSMGALRPSLHKCKEFTCLENDTQTYNKKTINSWTLVGRVAGIIAKQKDICTKKMLGKPTEQKTTNE